MKKLTKPDLPLLFIIVLAALAVPRVILHDLKLISFDSPLYIVLATGPFLIWLLVAIFRKTKTPVLDFLLLGLVFGLFLALTHQIAWDASWGSQPPQIQGNLEDKLSPDLESMILRTATFFSSLMTGLAAGAVLGGVATVASKLRAKQ